VNDPHVAVESESEHRVTPLELFFDLVFVFAITQVTSLLADDPTWTALLRGMLVLAAVWWTWTGYAWLTSAIDVDEGGVRLAVLAALIAMLFVALAVPGSFGDDAVLFGAALLVVRVLHIGLAFIASREDVASRDAIMRTAPTATAGAALILVAGFFDGPAQAAIWVVALALGYLGPVVMGLGRGWRLAPEHFTERYGLIMLIALGESIIAIGIGAGLELKAGVLVGAALGAVVVSALWWLYFDVAAIFARARLVQATGLDRARLARDAYNYFHLLMIAGVVLFALGLKTTLQDVGDALETVPAVALCGGVALYLSGHIGFLFRTTGRIFRRRSLAVLVLLALIPLAAVIPALASLALVTATCVLVVAYEALRYRESRTQIRHPELAA
jgi:low temperature requirement protein LtrA